MNYKNIGWFFRGIKNGLDAGSDTIEIFGKFTDFDKFINPTNPLYSDYKDRKCEYFHDKGYNFALMFRKLWIII